MKKHILAVVIALSCSITVFAEPAMETVRQQNMMLGLKISTCTLITRTAFVRVSAKADPDPDIRRLGECVAEGKNNAKKAHAEVKDAFKGRKKLPDELADWRLEWMAVFDAAMLRPSDTEGAYLRRVDEAQQRVERATNKLEIATE